MVGASTTIAHQLAAATSAAVATSPQAATAGDARPAVSPIPSVASSDRTACRHADIAKASHNPIEGMEYAR